MLDGCNMFSSVLSFLPHCADSQSQRDSSYLLITLRATGNKSNPLNPALCVKHTTNTHPGTPRFTTIPPRAPEQTLVPKLREPSFELLEKRGWATCPVRSCKRL